MIAVRAIDAAGNVRVEEYLPVHAPIQQQQIPILPFVAVIGIVGLIILLHFIRLL
jgi:hypothetical protein